MRRDLLVFCCVREKHKACKFEVLLGQMGNRRMLGIDCAGCAARVRA